MALQFHVDIAAAKDASQAFDRALRLLHPASGQRGGQRTFIASGKAHYPGGMFLQFFMPDCSFAFLRAQLHSGDQAAEILIAKAGRNEEGEADGIADRRFQIAD
jgi:hypothetical protein